MFDIFPKILSSVASILFPLFASYKALKTGDPAQLTPWLMYWVVLACALLVESWTEFILVWIPFYSYIRLLFLLYLVLPQTQGARVIYQTHVHPWLEDNESAIEDFIASAHDRLRAAGIAYLKRAIELLKTNVLGLPPDEPAAPNTSNEPATPHSYTQALLARFNLPSARWTAAGGSAGAEFYSLLGAAVGAVTGAGASLSGFGASSAVRPDGGSGASDLPDLSASGTLIPPSIRGSSAKMSFIAAQRERLNIVLSALDREAAQLAASEAERRREVEAVRAQSISLDGGDDTDMAIGDEPTPRPSSPLGTATGVLNYLVKSRSEADFEKIEAESGAEDGAAGAAVRRRTPAASRGSGWMSWGWGSGSDAIDKSSVGSEK